jgi:hypothetical protein
VHAFLADHCHQLFPPELFTEIARRGGHPSVPAAEVVATVMVLQALEGLSDREAISALRRDNAWKVACGLRLDDEGFHWDDLEATQVLVSGPVNDALAVLSAVGEVEGDAEQAEAVALLALVAGQDVEPGQRPGSWRIARRACPQDQRAAARRLQGPHRRRTPRLGW